MIEFDTAVRIDRAREHVFGVLAGFEANLARWAKGPVAARRTAGDGGAGSRYIVTARVGPAKVRSAYEVTGYDPPARLAGSGSAGPVRFCEEYSLTEDGPAAILTQSIRATPRGPFRLAERTLRRQLQQLIAADLGRLRNLAEAQGPGETAPAARPHVRGRAGLGCGAESAGLPGGDKRAAGLAPTAASPGRLVRGSSPAGGARPV